VQRKILTPNEFTGLDQLAERPLDRETQAAVPASHPCSNEFTGLDQLAERPLDFPYSSEATAKPFEWKFAKADLATLLARLPAHEEAARPVNSTLVNF